MTAHPIQTLLANDFEVQSYSGRGMYGNTCLGVTVPTRKNPIAYVASRLMMLALEDGLDEMDLVASIMADAQVDQLGHGHIVYFPTVEFCKK